MTVECQKAKHVASMNGGNITGTDELSRRFNQRPSWRHSSPRGRILPVMYVVGDGDTAGTLEGTSCTEKGITPRATLSMAEVIEKKEREEGSGVKIH